MLLLGYGSITKCTYCSGPSSVPPTSVPPGVTTTVTGTAPPPTGTTPPPGTPPPTTGVFAKFAGSVMPLFSYARICLSACPHKRECR